jgi:hypothetical protein
MQNRIVVTATARNGAHISIVSRHSENAPLEVREYGVKSSKGEIWITTGIEGLKRAYAMAHTLFNNPSFI